MENTLIFKKTTGEIIENVETYVKNWVKSNPHGSVIIGCDSQLHGRRIKYSVAVVMHHVDSMGGGHGAHVIVADIWQKRKTHSPIEEMPSKLWAEAEYTLIAAQMIDGNDDAFKKRLMLHLDFSDNAKDRSNMMFASGIGYLQGMGYQAKGKPHAYVATHTADAFCR